MNLVLLRLLTGNAIGRPRWLKPWPPTRKSWHLEIPAPEDVGAFGREVIGSRTHGQEPGTETPRAAAPQDPQILGACMPTYAHLPDRHSCFIEGLEDPDIANRRLNPLEGILNLDSNICKGFVSERVQSPSARAWQDQRDSEGALDTKRDVNFFIQDSLSYSFSAGTGCRAEGRGPGSATSGSCKGSNDRCWERAASSTRERAYEKLLPLPPAVASATREPGVVGSTLSSHWGASGRQRARTPASGA